MFLIAIVLQVYFLGIVFTKKLLSQGGESALDKTQYKKFFERGYLD